MQTHKCLQPIKPQAPNATSQQDSLSCAARALNWQAVPALHITAPYPTNHFRCKRLPAFAAGPACAAAAAGLRLFTGWSSPSALSPLPPISMLSLSPSPSLPLPSADPTSSSDPALSLSESRITRLRFCWLHLVHNGLDQHLQGGGAQQRVS